MFYLKKIPGIIKKIYSDCIWDIQTDEKIIYFTFDDGPHPEATPFVLGQLKKYHAKATFFCIGKNVVENFSVYQQIISEGHSVGNHTYSHLNGWKTKDDVYLADVKEAAKYIDSVLFRPPYGRITSFQARHIKDALKNDHAKIVMWDVISGDFDQTLSAEQCLQNIILNAGPGSIIVLHDSEKAFARLEKFLPLMLEFFKKNGFRFKKIGYQA